MSVEAEPELHQLLDENFNKLRNDLEEFFRRNQQTIADEQSKVYSPIINKLEGELHEALEEYEQTNEAARDNSNELARKNAILANLIKKSDGFQHNETGFRTDICSIHPPIRPALPFRHESEDMH